MTESAWRLASSCAARARSSPGSSGPITFFIRLRTVMLSFGSSEIKARRTSSIDSSPTSTPSLLVTGKTFCFESEASSMSDSRFAASLTARTSSLPSGFHLSRTRERRRMSRANDPRCAGDSVRLAS